MKNIEQWWNKAEKPEWLLMERASGLSQSRGTVMDPQQLCRSSQVSQCFRSFKGSCGICPPVRLHLQVNSASCYSEQGSEWLNFFYSLKSKQKPQHCLSFFISWHILYELNKAIIITWSEVSLTKLKFTSSKNQGKRSCSTSGRVGIYPQEKYVHLLPEIRSNDEIELLGKYKEKLACCNTHFEPQNLISSWRTAILR